MKIIQKTIGILFLLSMVQSCNFGMSGTKVNSQIDQQLRNEIKALNDRLFQSISSGDAAKARSMMSDKLLGSQSVKEIDELLMQLTNVLKSADYEVMDQYYVSNQKADVDNVLISEDKGATGYKINYKALNKEMVTSVLVSKGQIHDIMILLIYGKTGHEWKINILQFGQYRVYHKTAPEYLKRAKDSYEHSEMINAVTNIMMAKQCVTPGGKIFTYNSAKEINELHDKIMKEANKQYPLPKILNSIPTKPKLFRVAPEVFDDGVFPMVHYVSEINIKDTVALKAENEAIQYEVNKLFYGIDKHKKYVIYRAYDQMPDGKKLVKYYGFLDNVAN